jgi:hypothetical protein
VPDITRLARPVNPTERCDADRVNGPADDAVEVPEPSPALRAMFAAADELLEGLAGDDLLQAWPELARTLDRPNVKYSGPRQKYSTGGKNTAQWSVWT